MYTEYLVFDVQSMDDDLIKRFHRFFTINALDQLFLMENYSTSIKTSDINMRSLVNTGSSMRPFLELADQQLLEKATDNKRYSSALLRVLDEPKSYTKFVTIIKRVVKRYHTITIAERKYFWNIVFYDGTGDSTPHIFY